MSCTLTMKLVSESQEGNIGEDWRYLLEAKVFHGALAGEATDAQIGALMGALATKGETFEEVAGEG